LTGLLVLFCADEVMMRFHRRMMVALALASPEPCCGRHVAAEIR
jgi:hypothetical protein